MTTTPAPPSPKPVDKWRDYKLQVDVFNQGWRDYFERSLYLNPYVKDEDGFWCSYEEGYRAASDLMTREPMENALTVEYDQIIAAQDAFERV